MRAGSEEEQPGKLEESDGPRLDHVSLGATAASIADLGLRLTPTAGARDHARVFLDRSYLEVTPPKDAAHGLSAGGWFVRVPDLAQAALTLAKRGIDVGGPQRYEGNDGIWLDVTIAGESHLLPRLTQRLDVASSDWPPPIGESHPNGATAIAELRLSCSEPQRVAHALEALAATDLGGERFLLAGGCVIEIGRSPATIRETLTVLLTCGEDSAALIELTA